MTFNSVQHSPAEQLDIYLPLDQIILCAFTQDLKGMVVVLQGRAELTHKVTTQLESGVHHLSFQEVSPLIIPESVRLHGQAKGKAKGRVVSTETKTRYETKDPSAEIKQLEQKLKALAAKKRDLEFDRNVRFLFCSFSFSRHNQRLLFGLIFIIDFNK